MNSNKNEIEINFSIALKGLELAENSQMSIDDFLDQEFKNEFSLQRKRTMSLLFAYYRNKSVIDFMLHKAAKKLKPKVRRLLGLAVCQIHFQDALYTPVIVDIAVTIAKRRFGKSAGNFVNAVLRNIGGWQLDEIINEVSEKVKLNMPFSYLKRLKKIFRLSK